MMKENNNANNGMLMIILLAVASILVFTFPSLYDFVTKFSMPKVEELKTEEKEEEKIIDEDILETIHYPLMRNSIYNAYTYYSLDRFTVNNLSNEDILLNAFLDIYEGNMTPYESTGYCTSVSKQFNQDYLELRIKNIIGNKVSYTLGNFYVPEDADSSYVGSWNYEPYNGRFVYAGLCSSNTSNTKYYNLEELIKIEYENKDIVAYYYVGFAKVEGNNYTIYKDADMTEKILEGIFSSVDALNEEFKKINDKKIYKYTFKNTLCSYNEYCLYEGKWVNEL